MDGMNAVDATDFPRAEPVHIVHIVHVVHCVEYLPGFYRFAIYFSYSARVSISSISRPVQGFRPVKLVVL